MSEQKQKSLKHTNTIDKQNHCLKQDKPVQKKTTKKLNLSSDLSSNVSAKLQIRIVKSQAQGKQQKKENAVKAYFYLSETDQILLPKGALPLHVTKPTDIMTIKRALSHNQKIVIVQPKSCKPSSKILYNVGCLGKITTYCENTDGSLYVIVKGLQKCHIHGKKGSLVQISLIKDTYAKGSCAQGNIRSMKRGSQKLPWEIIQKESREEFIDTAVAFLKTASLTKPVLELKADLRKASDEVLVSSLTMACPLEAREKQAILECESTHEQLSLLYSFMIMGTYDKGTNFDKIHSSKSADCFFETQSVNLTYKH